MSLKDIKALSPKTLFIRILYIKNSNEAKIVFLVCEYIPLTFLTFVRNPGKHPLCEMFLKPFKTLGAHVLSGLKTIDVFTIKHCCSFFKHNIKD